MMSLCSVFGILQRETSSSVKIASTVTLAMIADPYQKELRRGEEITALLHILAVPTTPTRENGPVAFGNLTKVANRITIEARSPRLKGFWRRGLMEEERTIEAVEAEEEPTIELVTAAGWGNPDDCDPDGGWCVPNCSPS